MSFNEFLRRCEVLDLDVDPKMAQQGRLSARDIQKMKVLTQQNRCCCASCGNHGHLHICQRLAGGSRLFTHIPSIAFQQ